LTVQKTSLTALARQQLDEARRTPNGRAAKTVYGGQEHRLRQTVIAVCAGHTLDVHENPGEATVYVLQGRVVLSTDTARWQGWVGDHIIVPENPHSVHAEEDSVILLTVTKHR
jgi:quercetin dioxygenase-like cupin family protein